jgi:hypothetical protein
MKNGKCGLGTGHAKCLKLRRKAHINGRFLVLNIQFGVQNNRFKCFFEILFTLKDLFWGQKESFKTILGPFLGFFYCYYSQLPWPDPKWILYSALSLGPVDAR